MDVKEKLLLRFIEVIKIVQAQTLVGCGIKLIFDNTGGLKGGPAYSMDMDLDEGKYKVGVATSFVRDVLEEVIDKSIFKDVSDFIISDTQCSNSATEINEHIAFSTLALAFLHELGHVINGHFLPHDVLQQGQEERTQKMFDCSAPSWHKTDFEGADIKEKITNMQEFDADCYAGLTLGAWVTFWKLNCPSEELLHKCQRYIGAVAVQYLYHISWNSGGTPTPDYPPCSVRMMTVLATFTQHQDAYIKTQKFPDASLKVDIDLFNQTKAELTQLQTVTAACLDKGGYIPIHNIWHNAESWFPIHEKYHPYINYYHQLQKEKTKQYQRELIKACFS